MAPQESEQGKKNSGDLTNKAKDVQEKAKAKMGELSSKLNAKGGFDKATKLISSTPKISQFLIGGATGWCTGFMTTRVGKTACIIGGGSILLIGAMNQAGIVNVDWSKFGQKAETQVKNLQTKIPPVTNFVKGGKVTPIFAAGFVGGFLLGCVS